MIEPILFYVLAFCIFLFLLDTVRVIVRQRRIYIRLGTYQRDPYLYATLSLAVVMFVLSLAIRFIKS